MSRFLFRQGRWCPAGLRDLHPAAIGILFLCLVFGYGSALVGNVVAERPVLLMGVPLLGILVITYMVNPSALAVALILSRAALNPLFEEARFASFGGLGGLVNVALIALAITLCLRNPQRIPKQIWWAWLPFIACQAIACAYAPDKVAAIRTLLGHFATFAVLLIAFLLADSRAAFVSLAKALAASAIPVFMIVGWSVISGATSYQLEGMETVSNRYSAPFTHPNILAFYCLTFVVLFFYLLKSKAFVPGNAGKVALWVGLVGLFVVLLLTKTRSSWLICVLIFFSFGLLFERRYLIYLLLAGISAFAVPEVRDRLADLGQGNEVVQYAKLNSFAWRKLIWQEGLEWMEPARYLLGYGVNSFKEHSPLFFRLSGGAKFGAHNIWVQLFFETGVLGLAAFSWSLFSIGRLAIGRRSQDPIASFALVALLSGFALAGISDNMMDYLVSNQYLWFVVGLLLSLSAQAAPRSKDNDRQ